jgi:hypothetical protein
MEDTIAGRKRRLTVGGCVVDEYDAGGYVGTLIALMTETGTVRWNAYYTQDLPIMQLGPAPSNAREGDKVLP